MLSILWYVDLSRVTEDRPCLQGQLQLRSVSAGFLGLLIHLEWCFWEGVHGFWEGQLQMCMQDQLPGFPRIVGHIQLWQLSGELATAKLGPFLESKSWMVCVAWRIGWQPISWFLPLQGSAVASLSEKEDVKPVLLSVWQFHTCLE